MEDIMSMENLEKQIVAEQKNVDYNTREFTIEILVQKYLKDEENDKNELYVPDYQREFVWDKYRQSKFIESIILGLPVPLIFVAENGDGRLEIVDGSQRIRTLSAFINNELRIEGLEILTTMNGLLFSQISESRARKFKNTPLRMIVLAEKTTEAVKNDIFDRINRGSDLLVDMEKRKGIYRGKFNDFIYKECAQYGPFKEVTRINKYLENRQEREELILRYFAFSENYPSFNFRDGGIARFLDNYLANLNETWSVEIQNAKWKEFKMMIDYVRQNIPFGFSKTNAGGVSRVYFEALAVGIHFALKSGNSLIADKGKISKILNNPEFLSNVSGKYNTHTSAKINGRINYVKNSFVKR
jgi:hypothetical protein